MVTLRLISRVVLLATIFAGLSGAQDQYRKRDIKLGMNID
jgi:hypothetical protein